MPIILKKQEMMDDTSTEILASFRTPGFIDLDGIEEIEGEMADNGKVLGSEVDSDVEQMRESMVEEEKVQVNKAPAEVQANQAPAEVIQEEDPEESDEPDQEY